MNDEKTVLRSTEERNAGPVRASNGQGSNPWWHPWKQGLQLASQLVIATPLGLPTKVVQVAKYLNLLLGVWDSLEQEQKEKVGTENQQDAS